MLNFILSLPLDNGLFVVSHKELMAVDHADLIGIEMKVLTGPDPEFLKKRFEEHHKLIMKDWAEMVPEENTSPEAAHSAKAFAKFAKARIERYEHKLITAPMFANKPRMQVMFNSIFGEEAVNCLYEDGYYDPFDDLDIRSVDRLEQEIKNSMRFPVKLDDPFIMLNAAMSILTVANNSD